MAKVTSKLQVTIPKALAERYGIQPGQELDWLPAGEAIRVVPHVERERAADASSRLEIFDRATARQAARSTRSPSRGTSSERGWTREELYGERAEAR